MPTPKSGYWLEGVRIPSVTQILSRFKDSGGLIYWANQEGLAGRNCYDTTKKAADAGTLCHDMIDGDIRGHPVDSGAYPPEISQNALHAFKAYREWKRRVKLKVNHSELQLVSKEHRFGGTLDAMLVAGKLILGDWKTSNAIYTDHLIQVAGGYGLLWEENYPQFKLQGVEILRVSKPENNGDPISFHDHYWGPEVIPLAQKQFLLLREAYDLDKRIKGML